MKSYLKFKSFNSRKYIWKCPLENGGHLVLGLNVSMISIGSAIIWAPSWWQDIACSHVDHHPSPHVVSVRGVTIRVPHDTIRISIQKSRYNTYLDTYLNTVRCQRDVMSSMKAETPVIRSPAHNLLLQWMECLLLQLLMLSKDVISLCYIRVFPSIWSEENMCFN